MIRDARHEPILDHNSSTLNSSTYLQMLSPSLLQNKSSLIDKLSRPYFQQDEAPAHLTNPFSLWLDKHVPGRWGGSGGPITLSARSPDLA